MLDSPQLATEAGFTSVPGRHRRDALDHRPAGQPGRRQHVGAGRPAAGAAAYPAAVPAGRRRRSPTPAGRPPSRNPTPDFLSYQFDIRLGDQLTRQDGVIGYFAGCELRRVQQHGGPTGGRAAGLRRGDRPARQQHGRQLPEARLRAEHLPVPDRAGRSARGACTPTPASCRSSSATSRSSTSTTRCRRWRSASQLGPLLTVLGPSPTEGGCAPAYPRVHRLSHAGRAERQLVLVGTERRDQTWTGYGLVKASPTAQDTTTANTLREGYLQFITDLEQVTRPAATRCPPKELPACPRTTTIPC